jgi:hypothetical protein
VKTQAFSPVSRGVSGRKGAFFFIAVAGSSRQDFHGIRTDDPPHAVCHGQSTLAHIPCRLGLPPAPPAPGIGVVWAISCMKMRQSAPGVSLGVSTL